MSLHQAVSAGWEIGRWLALAMVLSLMNPAEARAQASGAGAHLARPPAPGNAPFHILIDCSPHKSPSPVFYLDGQRLDSTSVTHIIPSDIQAISVLPSDKAHVARWLGPEEGRRRVVFINTKAGQHTWAVRAFDRRLARLSRRQP